MIEDHLNNSNTELLAILRQIYMLNNDISSLKNSSNSLRGDRNIVGNRL